MNCYQCAVCSLPFQSLTASLYCSERCYIVDGMACYYQSFSNTTADCPSAAAAATTAIPSVSNWSLRTPEYDTLDLYYYHDSTSPQVRKNKILPPPTLSPILVPTPSQTTRRTTPTTATRSRSSSVSVSSWSANSSSNGSTMNTSVSGGSSGTSSGSSDDGEDNPLSTNWPKMDRFASSSSSFDRHLSSNGRAQWDPISLGWTITSDTLLASPSCTSSELPSPASAWEREEDLTLTSSSPRKYLALSASIWGPGWHQVEPLPPSFVKTLEQSELELQAQAQALALEKAALAAVNPKAIAKKAKREAKAAAAAAAALAAAVGQEHGQDQVQDTVMTGADSCSAVATVSTVDGAGSAPPNSLCSSRLPRSLQFVD